MCIDLTRLVRWAHLERTCLWETPLTVVPHTPREGVTSVTVPKAQHLICDAESQPPLLGPVETYAASCFVPCWRGAVHQKTSSSTLTATGARTRSGRTKRVRDAVASSWYLAPVYPPLPRSTLTHLVVTPERAQQTCRVSRVQVRGCLRQPQGIES